MPCLKGTQVSVLLLSFFIFFVKAYCRSQIYLFKNFTLTIQPLVSMQRKISCQNEQSTLLISDGVCRSCQNLTFYLIQLCAKMQTEINTWIQINTNSWCGNTLVMEASWMFVAEVFFCQTESIQIELSSSFWIWVKLSCLWGYAVAVSSLIL